MPKIILLFLLLFKVTNLLNAQTVLKGAVMESGTMMPLSGISVSIKDGVGGTRTDSNGFFILKTQETSGELMFSYLGYQKQSYRFNSSDSFIVVMEKGEQSLSVSISAKKKYRNKGNPAVELIKKIIENKHLNRQENTPFLQFDEYEKINLSFLDPGKQLVKNPLFKRFQFMMDNIDRESIPGKRVLPFYIEEKFYHRYFKDNPKLEKSLIKADKKIEFDDRLINNDGISTAVKYLYQNIDIYQNNIYLLTNSFMSPIADLAPTFYKFYIVDTTFVNDVKVVRLKFFPRNTTDLLFTGELFVTLDGQYAIEGADLYLNKNAAINWVNELNIKLEFERQENGRYYSSFSELKLDFAMAGFKTGLLGTRTQVFKNYQTKAIIPDFIFLGPKEESIIEDKEQMETFLAQQRPEKLSAYEAKTYTNYDSLKNMKSFKRSLYWGSFLFSGYLNLKTVEVGPWGSFFSGNPVEGFKLRLAARTTTEWSKRVYLAGNAGYGFKNQKLTHYLSSAYAFNKKSIYTFPQHYVQLTHAYDIRTPGLDIQFQAEGTPLLSFKRGENKQFLYDDLWQLNYVVESRSHLRFEAGLKRWNQQGVGTMHFIDNSTGFKDTVTSITSTEAAVMLRWAPGEEFFDQKNSRSYIPSRKPIFTAQFNMGIPDILGSEYDYKRLQLKIQKRFVLSQLGFADASISAGYLWGSVPYPFLFLPKANQSYGFMKWSFNMMNYMEFVSDQYVDLKIDYHLKGFIFNKIPLVKKLKWREVVGIKALIGNLREENYPGSKEGIFDFPQNSGQAQSTFPLNKTPYLEANVGIENIFKFFRVDYVKRLNYLDHPNVSNWGIRVGLQFTL